MHRHAPFFLITFSFFFTAAVFSQSSIYWDKSPGGTDNDLGFDLVPAGDGNYLIVGTTDSDDDDITFSHGQQDVWVVKMNADGDILWQKTYGGSLNDYARNIVAAPAGDGFVIGGSTFSNDGDISGNHGDRDAWVFKIDPDGALLWQHVYGGLSTELLNGITATTDGGYICSGNATSSDGDLTGNNGLNDLWVIKLDAAGNISWQKNYGGTLGDFGFDAAETPDGYCITGYSYSNDIDVSGHHATSSTADYWTIKTDLSGNIQWQNSAGGDLTDYATGVLVTAGGNFLISGSSFSDNGDVSDHYGETMYTDIWLLELDADGNIVTQKNYGGSYADDVNSFVTDLDGNYILTGSSGSNDFDISGHHGGFAAPDVLVMKISTSYDAMWNLSLGGLNDETGRAIYPYATDAYMSVSYTKSISGDITSHHGGSPNNDFWIVNLTPCQPTVLTDPNDVSACAGSSIELHAEVSEGNYFYTWVFASGLTVSTDSATLFIDPLTDDYAGDYYLVVTGACGIDTSLTANIDLTGGITPVLDTEGPVELCTTGPLLLTDITAEPGYTYQWYLDGVAISGATESSYLAEEAGSYTLTASNASGCSLTSEAVLFTQSLTEAEIDFAGSTTLCGGTIDLLTALISGYTYQWYKDGIAISGAVFPLYTADAAGSYTVEVTYGECIIVSEPVVLVNSDLEAAITAEGSLDICETGSVMLSNTTVGSGFSFQWLKNGTPISGANAISYTATDTGSYALIVSTLAGCTDTSLALKVFSSCDAVHNLVSENSAIIYPNPGNGIFTLAVHSNMPGDEMKITIYALTGATVYAGDITLQQNDTQLVLDLSELASGFYNMKLTTQHTTISKNITIHKQ